MRTPIIAGNWKMNTTAEEARALCESIVRLSNGVAAVEKVVCPPFVHLPFMQVKPCEPSEGFTQRLPWRSGCV